MMQLATSVDGQPWVCSVWFAADDNFNIYWFSSTTRRHSSELKKNPKVAAAIVLPQTPKDMPRGLQLEGTAEELSTAEDIAKARSVYEGRIFDVETINNLMAHPEKPHKFYKITPALFVLFDAVNFPDESRKEWKP
jgi:uncharacterized protein YhbP (UPF0306 family)